SGFDSGSRRPGELGRRRDPESNPEGPMAIAASGDGELAILDQVNHRIERWARGRHLGTIAAGGDTVQDIAPGTGGRTLVLDRLLEDNVQVYGADGTLVNQTPLAGK